MKIHSRIVIPEAAAKTGGALKDFVWDRMMEGDKLVYENDTVVLLGTDPKIQAKFADLVAIVQAGGSFEGITLAFTLTLAATQKLVPKEVPGATYQDENNEVQTRSFAQWAKINTGLQVIRHTSGSPYIVKAKWGDNLLNSESLAAIHSVVGASVIEWAEAVAMHQSEDYEVFEL